VGFRLRPALQNSGCLLLTQNDACEACEFIEVYRECSLLWLLSCVDLKMEFKKGMH
jgi:hypothetical protein